MQIEVDYRIIEINIKRTSTISKFKSNVILGVTSIFDDYLQSNVLVSDSSGVGRNMDAAIALKELSKFSSDASVKLKNNGVLTFDNNILRSLQNIKDKFGNGTEQLPFKSDDILLWIEKNVKQGTDIFIKKGTSNESTIIIGNEYVNSHPVYFDGYLYWSASISSVLTNLKAVNGQKYVFRKKYS